MVGFAVGLGSFAQGMSQGMQLAQQVKGALDDRKMRKVQKDGTAVATQAREKDIMGAIETSAGADGAPAYKVGGQSYASIDDARAMAEKQVGSAMDYYRQHTVPRLVQGYMDMGETERAERLQSWMESSTANRLTKDWAHAARLGMIGDTGGAMKGFGKLYERIEPGGRFIGTEDISEPIYEDVTGKDGKVTRTQTGTRPAGVRLRLKNASGEDVSHDFSGSEDLFQTAMFTLSPDKFAERAFQEVDRAHAARAAGAKAERDYRADIGKETFKARLDDQRDQRQHERSIIRDDRQFAQTSQRDEAQQGYKLEELMTSKQLEAAFAPALEAAKAKGETPETARRAITDIWKSLIENDLGNSGIKSKPIDQQVKQAAEIYKQQSNTARGVISGGDSGGRVPRLW